MGPVMKTVNVHEAKTHLSRLLEEVRRGRSFVIAKGGTPVAKVVPVGEGRAGGRRVLGFLRGEIEIPEDFDRMGQREIEELFRG